MDLIDVAEIVAALIPEDVENMKLPRPELIQFYKDINNRIIYIDDTIDGSLVAYIKYIIDWNKQDRGIDPEKRKPIKIFINSPGGDTDIMYAFMNAMDCSVTPIYTYVLGNAYSAAAFIFTAGHKRHMIKNSRILYHNGSLGVSGTTSQVMDTVSNVKKTEQYLMDYVINKTNITKQLWTKKYKTEWYISSDEAVELGISDETIADLSII